MGDSYVWNQVVAGLWSTASNWTDETTGSSPASVAPGSADDVTIDSVGSNSTNVISGAGDSASLTIAGSTSLEGTFSTGVLTIEAGVSLSNGSTVSANALQTETGGFNTISDASLIISGNATDGGSSSNSGAGYKVESGGLLSISGNVAPTQNGYDEWDDYWADGGRIVVGGTFTTQTTFWNGAIAASNGGSVQLGDLNGVAQGYSRSGTVEVAADSTSRIEIGNAGDAVAGSITIDPNITVSECGLFAAPEIVVNGTLDVISDSYLEIDGGSLAATDFQYLSGDLTGPTIISANEGLTGYGQIRIGTNSGLYIDGVMTSSENTIVFAGAGGVFNIDVNDLSGSSVYLPSIDQFGSADSIKIATTNITSASYNNGILTLLDGTTTIGALKLNGNYYGQQFTVSESQSNETQINVTGTSRDISDSSDFTGSGASDILFRDASSGETYLWTMSGATVISGAPTSTQVDNNWQIEGVGDFNGDGTSDLLWVYNDSANAADPLNGVSYISMQSGPTATSGSGVVEQLSTDWQVAGVGDFNGDGMSDVLYRNASTGQTYLNEMDGAAINWSASGLTSQQVTDPNWTVASVADFTGDGDADVLWRYDNTANSSDPLNGALYEWQMNGATVTSAGLLSQQPGSLNWTVAGTGDFDGNGTADILLRYENSANASDPLNGLTYIDFMNGSTVTSGAPTQWQADNSWVVAGIGDYNGDGKSDILWQQTSTGDTYIWEMNGASVTAGAFTSQQAGAGWAVQNGVHIG